MADKFQICGVVGLGRIGDMIVGMGLYLPSHSDGGSATPTGIGPKRKKKELAQKMLDQMPSQVRRVVKSYMSFTEMKNEIGNMRNLNQLTSDEYESLIAMVDSLKNTIQ